MENWRIDLVDLWNDGAIVGTFATPAEAYEAIRKLGHETRGFATPAEAYEAIRKLGQETRGGQWRYTLAPVLDPAGER